MSSDPQAKVAPNPVLSFRACVSLTAFTLEVDEDLELEGVTGIFGASGSGKSTLLRAIAGLIKPQRGRIAFRDRVLFDQDRGIDVPTHERQIGFLFQDGRLFSHLDVAGNLAFGERRRAASARRFERDDVLTALDLARLLPRRVDSLSGGERQRVALGRTLLASPDLLLLDEPLSALDRDRKREILPYLEEVIERFRMPTLFVSHDVDEIAQLADQVWVLSDGQLKTSGPTAEILERLDLEPLTGRFEAGVLIEARVVRHDPRLHLTIADLHGDELAMPYREELAPGTPVRMRIRARDVAVATERPVGLSIRNVLAGEVIELVREPNTGAVETMIQLREDRIRARLTLAAVEELGLEVGSSVFALIKSVSLERES